MASLWTLVEYVRCDNAGEHKSKLQKAYKKEKVMLKYMTTYTHQLNGII